MRVWIFLLLTVFAAAPAEAASKHHAAQPEQIIPVFRPIITNYDVYVGGFHFLTAEILFQEQSGKYRARFEGHTYGVWHKLLPWDNHLQSNGDIREDRFVPTEYYTYDAYGKKIKETKLHFAKDGDVKAEFNPPSHDENREQVTFEQRRGSLDPISALLQMLAYLAVQKNCNVTVPIFDGKRLFDVSAFDTGHQEIDEEDYGVFKGNARTCDATFKSIAGEWKNDEKDKFWKKSANQAGRDPFHIWLGTVSPDLPELPVRLESGSMWGFIIMHLKSWRYATPEELKT